MFQNQSLFPSLAFHCLPLPLVLADPRGLAEAAGRALLLSDVIAAPAAPSADYVDLLVLLPEAWRSLSYHIAPLLNLAVKHSCEILALLDGYFPGDM